MTKEAAAQDAKGKEGAKATAEVKKAAPVMQQMSPLAVLYRNIATLDKAAEAKDRRMVLRVLRQTAYVRQYVTPAQLAEAAAAVTDAGAAPLVNAVLAALPSVPLPESKDEEDVELTPAGVSATSAAPATPTVELVKAGKLPTVSPGGQKTVGAYFLYLGVAHLVHAGDWSAAFEHAAEALAWLGGAARHTCAAIAARLYAALALAGERQGLSARLEQFLLREYRTACLSHNDTVQATLLNLLLRHHISTGAYAAADKLMYKTEFPESVSNNQLVRHLYYGARVAAVQTDYPTAHSRATQALRKAPSGTAEGFRTAVTKLSVVVQLLLGEVPDKAVFHVPRTGGVGDATSAALAPYLAVTQAVRVGDTAAFHAAVQAHAAAFTDDGNLSLIQRLTHTVIKAGLKKIARSYSRISFADVAAKLGVASSAQAEALCAKAIRDGVIAGTLNAEEGTLTSSETADVYGTTAPAEAFHRRISFLLDVKTEAVRSMQYPPEAYKKALEGVSKAAAEVEDEEAEIADAIEKGELEEDDEEE